MEACEQAKGQSVLAHGQSVHKYALELVKFLRTGEGCKDWRLPEWIHTHRTALLERLVPLDDLMLYAVYHDCGKPYCRVLDKEGRVHFPEHAAVSASVWREAGGTSLQCRLIAMDMDFHLLKAEGLAEFARRPEAATLMIVGLAEIHSNAAMFGGIDSVSFKIKWKQLDRRGRQVTEAMFTQSVA